MKAEGPNYWRWILACESGNLPVLTELFKEEPDLINTRQEGTRASCLSSCLAAHLRPPWDTIRWLLMSGCPIDNQSFRLALQRLYGDELTYFLLLLETWASSRPEALSEFSWAHALLEAIASRRMRAVSQLMSVMGTEPADYFTYISETELDQLLHFVAHPASQVELPLVPPPPKLGDKETVSLLP